MTIDGGANAIRGFNYQKAIIALIAILNYKKNDFEIFLENQDDVEVLLEKTHTFIQIKSKKNSTINYLTKADKKTNQSILSKNLSKNPPCESKSARYKIISPNFSENDRKNLIETVSDLNFDKIYNYSNSQKNQIIGSLSAQNFNQKNLELKLSNSYLFFSTFDAEFCNAIPYLKGKMLDCDISVDNKKGNIAINELFTQIDVKSEISPTLENPYNPRKKIKTEDLKIIFVSSCVEDIKDRIWKDIKSNFNSLTQLKIEKEIMRYNSIHKAIKNQISNKIGLFSADQDLKFLTKTLYDKVKDQGIDNNVLYALIVIIIAEKINEELI